VDRFAYAFLIYGEQICLIDSGDISLVTDPAYPVYSIGSKLAGGEVFYLPLTAERNFLPDLDSIPEGILKRSKVLWLNYPNNPTLDLNIFRACIYWF